MKHVFWLQALLSLLLSIPFCSLSQAQAVNLPPNHAADTLSPCPKFQDAQNQDEAEDNYVIYRDMLKAKQWAQAFAHWQKVYAVAPAADGRRATVYLDGIRIYQHFYSISQDSLEKDSYIDRIFELYDDIQSCYSEIENIPARKAFDLYHKYPHRASREEIFQLCKEALDGKPERVSSLYIVSFSSLLKELVQNEQIELGEARRYADRILEVFLYNKKHCQYLNDCQYWAQIESTILGQIELFERVKGFYDCEYFLGKYYRRLEKDSTDCDLILEVENKLKSSGCELGIKVRRTLYRIKSRYCQWCPRIGLSRKEKAFNLLIQGKYAKAEQLFYEEAWEIGRESPRVSSLFLIAKICYSHLKRFNKAREYAKKAAALKKDWGEPYILLGQIYAASDALCKEDTDKLYLPWLAMDQWLHAKKIDPAATAMANK